MSQIPWCCRGGSSAEVEKELLIGTLVLVLEEFPVFTDVFVLLGTGISGTALGVWGRGLKFSSRDEKAEFDPL